MNSDHGAPVRQQAKRAVPAGRVLPALPLTMTRPKTAKPKPTQAEKSSEVQKELLNGSKQQEQAANGTPNGHVGGQELVAEPRVKDLAVEADTPRRIIGAQTPAFEVAGRELAANQDATPDQNGTSAKTGARLDLTSRLASPRKVGGRSDARAAKTELPPAFVPHQHTPMTSASTHADHILPDALAQNGTRTASRPGRASSPSSPTPPQSADSLTFPPPGLPFTAPHHHAHHFSEPNASWNHSAHMSSQVHWGQRPLNNHSQQQFPPQHSHHHRGPSRDAALSNGSGAHQRGRADTQVRMTDLQSPIHLDQHADRSRMAFNDNRFAFQNGRGSHMPPMQAIPFSPHGPPDSPYIDHTGVDPLRYHLLRTFESQEPLFADCVLNVTSGDGETATIKAHRMILARSTSLYTLLSNSGSPPSQTFNIHLSSRYLNIGLLHEGIRHLYGGPLPSFIPFGQTPPTDRIAKALEYVALGSYLQIDAIAHRAMQAVLSLLHWDTIPAALAFALDGGLSSSAWDDGAEITSASDSSSDDLARPESGAPTYDPFATDLLHHIINFAVHTIPQDFHIDPSAPELPNTARLPPTSTSLPPPPPPSQSQSQPSVAAASSHARAHTRTPSQLNPRLSQIRFGELASAGGGGGNNNLPSRGPPEQATAISSVLLSLPFPLLRPLLEAPALGHRLGPETLASVTRQVIQERERRRERAVQAQTVAASNGSSASAAINGAAGASMAAALYWRESVEPSALHPAGCRLARRRVGVHTPPSELAE